jgi:hypothetical protein
VAFRTVRGLANDRPAGRVGGSIGRLKDGAWPRRREAAACGGP